jgi:phage-related tail fiber protein
VPDGTAAAPSITNTGDENTGIFFGAADEVSITTGGTERAQFDSNGLSILAQKPVRYYDADSSHYVELKAASTVSANVSLTLPTSDGDADQFLKTDGSGALSWATVSTPAGVPTGSVFTMATTTVPSGYLECNGAAVSRTTYADLFSAIGTTWGSGNGSTTFNVPDLRGEFVRGWDNGRGVDSSRSFATFQDHAFEDHEHLYDRATTGSDVTLDRSPEGRNSARSSTHGVVSGANTANETRPRNIAMMYVIKT